MSSKYIRCNSCDEVIDRKPLGFPQRSSHDNDSFSSGEEIRSYAASLGWSYVEGNGYNGGEDYCPKHRPIS